MIIAVKAFCFTSFVFTVSKTNCFRSPVIVFVGCIICCIVADTTRQNAEDVNGGENEHKKGEKQFLCMRKKVLRVFFKFFAFFRPTWKVISNFLEFSSQL
jgi:hypothetical protein